MCKICDDKSVKFEWDNVKSDKNSVKHGLDFEPAKDLWLDDYRIEIHVPHPIENRRILKGKLNKKLWTAVYTLRGDTVRIISVRRSREKEKALYEKQKTGQERQGI